MLIGVEQGERGRLGGSLKHVQVAQLCQHFVMPDSAVSVTVWVCQVFHKVIVQAFASPF